MKGVVKVKKCYFYSYYGHGKWVEKEESSGHSKGNFSSTLLVCCSLLLCQQRMENWECVTELGECG